ncbi:MAG: hypothetical protein VB128_10595 [Sedimentibacter saalensis]|jgi:hypothetical protein|uniref:hypothetical protein n=1 Tax=Sedimentibacter saalensis TaxID=130788 RepID=UPI002B1ECC36|nr:hypothetical protein [Sedimentibacter saalensis]MEA5095394.1 hypothetical protein [Sedimentibacter saalensis]
MSLGIELVKDFEDNNNYYNEFNIDGVNVFIQKSIKMDGNVEIIQLGSVFKVTGLNL